MNKEEYNVMMESQDTHWWWKARSNILKKLLDKYFKSNKNAQIADVGSGAGSNLKLLKQFGNVLALEPNSECVDYLKINFNSVEVIQWTSPNKIHRKFDLIVFADVLEHIKNDKEALQWSYDHLNPGGYLLLTLPAHMYLWSQMDMAQNHYRRYNIDQIKELLSGNFNIVFFSYYNFFLFPVKILFILYDKITSIYKNRKISSHNNTPNLFINYIFEHILKFETFFLLKKLIPYGVSIVCLVKKINK